MRDAPSALISAPSAPQSGVTTGTVLATYAHSPVRWVMLCLVRNR